MAAKNEKKGAKQNANAEVTQTQQERDPKDRLKKVPPVMSMDAFLKEVKLHPGLIASYRYEAQFDEDMLRPKTFEGWEEAFDKQSKRQYK